MRGVLGADCPTEGCPEGIIEICREGAQTVAYCDAGHDCLVGYNGPTDFNLFPRRRGEPPPRPPRPRPGPPEPPDISAPRRWGDPPRQGIDWVAVALFIFASAAVAVFLIVLLGTEPPPR